MRIPEIEWILTSAKQKRSSQSTKHSRNCPSSTYSSSVQTRKETEQWLSDRMRLRDATLSGCCINRMQRK